MTPAPRHHLDDATLVSHASGALRPEFATIAAIHLVGCAVCRARLAQAERVGGVLVEQQQPVAVGDAQRDRLRQAMLRTLAAEVPAARSPAMAPADDPDSLPAPLHPYFGTSYRTLPWRWMGPAMHYIRTTGPTGATLLMLKIGPGKRMPMHGHGGSELTQILQGAYDDALGRFAAGDAADLDLDTEHQPVTVDGAPCICVAALDAPLRLQGWIARGAQRLFGF